MSKKPSFWIKKLNKYVDVIIFHLEIEEPIEDVIKLCKNYNKKIGLALNIDSDIDSIIKYLPELDFIQVMGISELGKSGQEFNLDSLKKVSELNKLKKDYNFEIIFDGGVKPSNISRINAKYIVSSSGLLSSENPIKAFMELKTDSRYSPITKQLREDIINGIKSTIESISFIKSGNIVGSFSENKGIRGISDIDIVIISDKLSKQKFNLILEKFNLLKNNIQSKYGYEIYINPTLGPLKFDKSIVFHLMVYDIKSHKLHCEKSPFTCLDWQRSEIFFKKPMSDISSVKSLHPNNFFSSRRSADEYLSEIKSNQISYREYKFNKDKLIEEKKYRPMDKRDKIEFSYHILRFLISNFLKLYYRENKIYNFNEMLNKYFNIFPKNNEIHKELIKKIYYLKENKRFIEIPDLIRKLEFFIKDFESQFKNHFYNSSTEMYFLRHAKTKMNKKNLFIGQKSNPDIIKPTKKLINNLKEKLNESNFLLSSPSKRCINTLKLITDKNLTIDNRLKEIDCGDIDGRDLKYISVNYPDIIEAWKKGEDPKFPNGENYLDLIKRIKDFTNSIKPSENKSFIICTHNVFLKALIGSNLKIPIKDWFKITIPHTDPIKFIKTNHNNLYIDLTDNQVKEIFKNL